MSEAGKCFSPPLPSFLPSFLRDRLVVSFGGGGGSQLPRRFPPGLEGPSHQASHRIAVSHRRQTEPRLNRMDGGILRPSFTRARLARPLFIQTLHKEGYRVGMGWAMGMGGWGAKFPQWEKPRYSATKKFGLLTNMRER